MGNRVVFVIYMLGLALCFVGLGSATFQKSTHIQQVTVEPDTRAIRVECRVRATCLDVAERFTRIATAGQVVVTSGDQLTNLVLTGGSDAQRQEIVQFAGARCRAC